MPYVPCALHALVPHVPRPLRTFALHAPYALHAFVSQKALLKKTSFTDIFQRFSQEVQKNYILE